MNQPASEQIDIVTQLDTLTTTSEDIDVMRVCTGIDGNMKILKMKEQAKRGQDRR